MGNATSDEAGQQDEEIERVDKRDPSTKRKKTKRKAKKGAEVEDGQLGFEEEQKDPVSVMFKDSEFAPDPELMQGFPEDKVEFSTTPCLEDVNDEYTQQDKARILKKKDKSGAADAYIGSNDFAEKEVVEE